MTWLILDLGTQYFYIWDTFTFHTCCWKCTLRGITSARILEINYNLNGKCCFSVIVDCMPPFTRYNTGCYLAPNPAAQISWEAAESQCQTYGTNVHLIAGDTHQVSGQPLIISGHGPNQKNIIRVKRVHVPKFRMQSVLLSTAKRGR